MAIENTVSSDFEPRSLIVNSVFDYRLPDMILVSYIGQNPYLNLFKKELGDKELSLSAHKLKWTGGSHSSGHLDKHSS